MNTASVAVATSDPSLSHQAHGLAQQLQLPVVPLDSRHVDFLLVLTPERLECRCTLDPQSNPLAVDFLSGPNHHRYRYGGGKKQLIAKAVGMKKEAVPHVLDVTAGLGRDGFVLASLGCDVTLLERSPIIAALVADGLQRAKQQQWFQTLSLQLRQQDAVPFLQQLTPQQYPDVIFCDPMFPDSKKSALVKKEMRYLRSIVGDDADADQLLTLAKTIAKKRVVVKRAYLAPILNHKPPDLQYKGKSSRFDVYLTHQK